jgi:hypothetical protein
MKRYIECIYSQIIGKLQGGISGHQLKKRFLYLDFTNTLERLEIDINVLSGWAIDINIR